MRIYNTLTRRLEEIVPREAGKLGMYSCGPTVYRYIHIGNLRTFTMADWIRRASCQYRSEEHTSELQSHLNLVCRLLLEKKKEMSLRISGHLAMERDRIVLNTSV